MRTCLSLLTICLILGVATSSYAQAFGDAASVPPVNFGKDNVQLRQLMDLQYQMQLLKRLIEREKVANNMMAAAIAVGISDPAVPQPDRDLCAAVPANMPCAKAYDDLYPGFSVKPAPAKLVAITPPNLPAAIDKAVGSAVDKIKDIAPVIAEASFYWTDITCRAQFCSAVISPDPADPASRYRVHVGEKLPDGSVIQAISAAGVTLTRGKKQVKLDPAPAA